MRRKYSESAASRGRRGKLRFRRSCRAVFGCALFCFALLAAPTACARRAATPPSARQSAPNAAPPAQPMPVAPAKPAPGQGMNAKSDPKVAQAEAPKRPSRKALSASTRAFGLGSPSLARLPEDFSIGPLQDYRAPTGAETEVLSVAKRFLEGLEKGKLDESLLVPDSRRALALLLAPAEPAASPDAARNPALPYRVGRIALSEDGASASLRVRLGSRAGEERIEGSLALGLVDGAWYVVALSLDPPEKGGRDSLSFDPSRMGSS